MKRRELISLTSFAALSSPIAAYAQQSAVPVIGFLRNTSFEESPGIVAAFRQGLTEAGFVEGQNVVIEFRSAEGRLDRLPALVTELLQRPVAVIVANPVAAVAAKAATTTVPIVFASAGDPIRDGLVASLSRPGGNVTGVTFLNNALGAKQLELLREVAPGASSVGFLLDTVNVSATSAEADVRAAASTLGIRIVVTNASSAQDIEDGVARFAREQVGAILCLGAAFFLSRRDQIIALAARHSMPAIYVNREYVAAGGLMSYGGSIADAYRQAGLYAGRILKGTSPADLPVMQSTRVEMVINLRTARALGLTIAPITLLRADEIIE